MGTTEIDKKKVLGRGLASLIPEAVGASTMPGVKKDFFLCEIEKIVPNTYQPRKVFEKGALEELTESIKVHGIIQPLVVRKKDNHYELIAGERRWRAAQKAGLKQVPVVVKEMMGDSPSLEMAIIENIQRENLNCIEEAMAYQQLVDEFHLSQEDIASRVGKNRATIANLLRLLKLSSSIREEIVKGAVTMGHARALLSLEKPEDQLALTELIIKKRLSVRDTEKKVSQILKDKNKGEEPQNPSDIHIQSVEDNLRRHFGIKVRIVGTQEKGFIQFMYSTKDDLMRIVDTMLPKQ